MNKTKILIVLIVLINAEYSYCQKSLYESTFITLEYTDQVDSTNFVITSKTEKTSDVYFAFGLSNDFDQMVNYIISKNFKKLIFLIGFVY